jgi:predicted phage terminase large subunit-like protein
MSSKQCEFRHSTSWVRGFVAGRGSGKTVVGAIDVLARSVDGDPWMSVSPTFSMIHETTLPTFVEVARRLDLFVRLVKSPVPRCTFRASDGGMADIVFRSGEDPERLRGPNKAGLWIDEASICKPDTFKIGIGTLRHRGRMGPVILTFTPRGRRHWTFETFFHRVEPGAEGRYAFLDGQVVWIGIDPVTESEAEPQLVVEFSGLRYVRAHNTQLVQAATWDNPFLPEEFYRNIRQHYSTQLAAQELSGDFVDLDGLMFKREWFTMVDEVPAEALRVRYWDRAATGVGENRNADYSAGVLMARTANGQFYVEHVIRGQWTAHQRDKIIESTAYEDAKKYVNAVMIYIEQEGGSGGKEVAQQAVVNLARFPVNVDRVTGIRKRHEGHQTLPGDAKVVRARPLQSQAENGRVWVKRGSWNEDWLEELCSFPEYVHDDMVDATSGALNKLASLTGAVGGNITRTNVEASRVGETKFGIQLNESAAKRLRTRGYHKGDDDYGKTRQ